MSELARRIDGERGTRTGVLLARVVGITNLSQMPVFVNMQITRYISTPLWLLLFLIIFFRERQIKLKGITFFVTMGAIIGAYSYIMRIFVPAFAASDLLTPILLSVFVLINGVNAGGFINDKDLDNIFTVYIITSLAVCLSVYFSYLRGNSLASRFYLYDSKNSVTQIIWTGMILILFTKFKRKTEPIFKVGYAAAFAIMMYSLIMLKSRAVLICIPVVFILVLLHGKVNKTARIAIIIVLLAAVVLLSNEQTYNIFVKDVVYAGRDATDIDDLSSHRSEEWEEFGRVFFQTRFLIGSGRYKMESIILTALLEYGIFVGSAILSLAIAPIVWVLRHMKKTDPNRLILLSVAISYAINGIFEQLAPFGPGAKCYFLWLLLGLMVERQTADWGETQWQTDS